MKRKMTCIETILIVLLFFFPLQNIAISKEWNDKSPPINETFDKENFLSPFNYLSDLSEKINELGFSLYKDFKDNTDNILFSPYSIFESLAFLHSGADEETAKEISNLMRIQEKEKLLEKPLSVLRQSINRIDRKNFYLIRSTHSLQLQKEEEILSSFYIKNKEHIHKVDDNIQIPESSTEKREDLPKNYKIKKNAHILHHSSFQYKALWEYVFSKGNTKTSTFQLPSLKTIQVEMMEKIARFKVLEEKHFSMLELPYAEKEINNERLLLYILLPRESTLEYLEGSINEKNIKHWISSSSIKKIKLLMPKFKCEKTYSLREILEKRGGKTPFSKKANFSKINGRKNLRLKDLIHSSSVSIEEEGSNIEKNKQGKRGHLTVFSSEKFHSFKVNRPFLFFLLDKHSQIILLIGKIYNPTE